MLARLDQIDGVESSLANESGTLIRLSLWPSADPARIVRAAHQVLNEQVGDRIAVQLGSTATAAALQRENWRDKSQVTEFAVTEIDPSSGHALVLWAVLLLGCAALGLGLFCWRYRAGMQALRADVRGAFGAEQRKKQRREGVV